MRREKVDRIDEFHSQTTQKIDMTKPQPCTAYKYAQCQSPSSLGWLTRLLKEKDTIINGALKFSQLAGTDSDKVRDNKAMLAEKLTNVIHACVSWLHALGYDEKQRGELHRRVNEKNKARGYF
jgi:hypothetical protein